jgi:MFS transporter, FLVCR family, MFS-domain-containing protein 7
LVAAGALRGGPDAHPPLNMLKALIFMGVFAMVICSLIFLLRGEQKRKMMDEEKLRESAIGLTSLP